jgi:2-polyprenyl-3-methyl-5-hydroxy-6-metoxy-1,4-benzoquinol methylase
LPGVSDFAGARLAQPLPGGRLWRCQHCSFVFRDPILADSHYQELYEAGSATLWEGEEQRIDFSLLHQQILAAGNELEILDIGCHTGLFLAGLPPRYRRYGVEPNEAAAKIAASRGLTMVAQTVDGLDERQQFDVITACDVIEHVASPLAFLDRLQRHLRPGGRIMISTGDSDAWLWKIAGARYWYCYFPEHISFINAPWLLTMSRRLGMSVTHLARFNYRSASFTMRSVRSLLGAALYAAQPTMYRRVRQRWRKNSEPFSPPGCGAVKDHLLCVLRRGDQSAARERAALTSDS